MDPALVVSNALPDYCVIRTVFAESAAMLDILTKLLGPHRAVSLYIFLQRRGLAIGLVIVFVAILGFILSRSDPDRMEHVAYHLAEVKGVEVINNNASIGVYVSVELPDGTLLKLTETEGAISGAIVDTACVEQRRTANDGSDTYRLRRAHRCALSD